MKEYQIYEYADGQDGLAAWLPASVCWPGGTRQFLGLPDKSVPMGLHTPTILLTREQLRSEEVGGRVMCFSQGRVAREVRERREEEVLEEAREENEGEEFLFKWVTTV